MNASAEEATIERRRLTGRATVIFLAVMLLLTFFSKTINNFTLPKVTVETPANGALIKEVADTGNVEAKMIRDLYVRTSMRVTGVMVQVGDSVQEGQTLLTLDTTDLDHQIKDEQDKYAQKKLYLEKLIEASSPLNLLGLDKAVQTAQQNLDKGQRDYDNSEILFEAGAVAAIDLTNAKMNLDNVRLEYEIALNNRAKTISDQSRDIESTKLDIHMAERKLAELSKEMNMGTVKAPCDGIVTELFYSEGVTATTSQPLYKLADTEGGFQFVATVNINAADYLGPGDIAEISINSLNDKVIQGKVSQIKDNQQQIGVKKDVIIDIPLEGLIGGEIGTANIRKSMGSYNVLIANSAVGQDNNGYFVYVLKERDGPLGKEFYVEKVSVSIGDSDNIKTAVLSGINARDKVVSNSDKPLSDNSSVMLAN